MNKVIASASALAALLLWETSATAQNIPNTPHGPPGSWTVPWVELNLPGGGTVPKLSGPSINLKFSVGYHSPDYSFDSVLVTLLDVTGEEVVDGEHGTVVGEKSEFEFDSTYYNYVNPYTYDCQLTADGTSNGNNRLYISGLTTGVSRQYQVRVNAYFVNNSTYAGDLWTWHSGSFVIMP